MKCPICGAALPLHSDRCPDCGFRCAPARPQEPQSEAPKPRTAVSGVPYTPPKTKSNRGCCCALAVVIPILIAALIVFFVAANRIVTDFSLEIFEDIYEDIPVPAPAPESLPAPADEGCFAAAENTLMFLPENWDGGPVLNIPDTIGGETVTNIGPGCFAGCDFLTTIILPDTVTIISPMAFSGCTALRGLHLPDGLQTIGPEAFAGCADLEAITVPASVEHIAPGVFDDCASLRYIFYGGTFEDWDALYSDYINPFTTAICLDGGYYHGSPVD